MERKQGKFNYSKPSLEIVVFQVKDVITTSGDIFGENDTNPDSWTKPN